MKYALINNGDGLIKKVGHCSVQDFSLQGRDGCTLVEAPDEVSVDAYRYVDGEFIEVDAPVFGQGATTRAQRNRMLLSSDWTQVPDSPLTNAEKAAWATYRQSLRDITSHANWPNLDDDDWPTMDSV